MDYLSKKAIVDKTEKLALARIGTKLGISSEQVELVIKSLSAKNLIRKVYLQSGVGFELTPRGKSEIEALAKAETDRITKQLQESIHKERKAKLRVATVSKAKSIADKWQNYPIPKKDLMNEIEQEAIKLLAVTKEIQVNQPLCQKDPQNYDQEFSKYKLQIENLSQQNGKLTKAVNNYSQVKEYQLAISDEIESIAKTIKKYELISEATTEVSRLKGSIEILKPIQSQLDAFDKEQLSRFVDLKTQLVENLRLLETLKKSTHEFASTRRERVSEKENQSPDPECPIKYDGKTTSYSLEEKCVKCGAKRKSSSVTIG